MRQLTENEKTIKSIRNSAKVFLDKINAAYNRGNKRHQGYINWYLNNVGFGCRTFVSTNVGWYNSAFYITLDANNILEYAETNGVDVDTATKLLVSHEIFHILLGHFSSKYKDHNKRLLNIAGDLEINQLINLHEPGIQVYDYGYKPFRNTDYYYDQLIAEAEEKMNEKELIAMICAGGSDSGEGCGTPFGINIESFPNSDDAEDSSMTSGDSKESEKNSDMLSDDMKSSGSDSKDEDEDINNNITIHKMNGETIKPDDPSTSENKSSSSESPSRGHEKRSSIEDEVIDEMIPEDRHVNEATVETMENEVVDINFSIDDIIKVENTIKKELSRADTYEIDGLNEIIRKIINKEKSMKITPHGRQASYYKLNNRRQSDFLLPGKKLTNDGIKKKFDSSPVVFIDVSGSTHGRVNTDLMNVAKKLHKIGATIVYYENSITSVCEPNDTFFTEGAGGGTDITNTIRAYLANFEAFDRAYVFTDGYDNFTYLKSVCDKFNIYFIQGNRKVYEKYNEKSNIPNRWG